MANKRDLLDKACQAPKKSTCSQSSDDLFCYDKRPPSYFHDHGPDDDDDDDDDEEEDDDDDEDEEDEDHDDDDDEDEEDGEEEDRLRNKKHTHYASDYHPNPMMSYKITKQFCEVHHIGPTCAKRGKAKTSAKVTTCNASGEKPSKRAKK